MRNRNWNTYVLPIFCLLAIAATKKPPTVEEMLERRGVLNDEITSLTRTKTCQSDLDCGVLEVGIKPCGGPWKYVIYSKKTTKAPVLKQKISEYNKLDKQINEAQQAMSDCMIAVKPVPKCEKPKHVCSE